MKAPFTVSAGSDGVPSLRIGGHTYVLAKQRSWVGGGWRHFEATSDRLTVDGIAVPVSSMRGSSLSLRVQRGNADLRALVISAVADRAALLFHRLAELHARIPPSQFPVGADLGDGLHIKSTYWTSGFWPGVLWQAAAIEGGLDGRASPGAMLGGWALSSTLHHFGQEHSDSHDVGFIYGESSLAAWRALCGGASGSSVLCARLRRSVIGAADQLRTLAASNPRAGTIPTNSAGLGADTIVDSTMNIAILPWATSVTGNPAYERLASHHAHVVASLLVRADGSTAQSVHFDRATGRVLFIHTHQGLSSTSTWSRGQGWAVYGFAQAAAQLRDKGLLRVALRTAGYVARRLPAGGVPRWDYDAPSDAPVDVSAGVITAAGLFHLAAACQGLPGVCVDPRRWVVLGRRMLAAAVGHVYARPPLGFLSDQVLNERGHGCWCDGGELIFGLTYALEALKLARAS
jgi:unsaturated chondroitin disaccharide hydrolase